MSKRHYLDGFTPPTGVQNAEQVATIQRRLGVTDDGVWGPKTDSAYRSYMSAMSRSPKPATTDPLKAAAALNNAAHTNGRTFGGTGYTADTFLKPKAPEAYAAITNASIAHGRTFGNPGFIPSIKIDTPDVLKDPQAALTKIIDASSLGDKDKWRAKYTIDGMGTEVLQNLLQDVLRDGVDAYFTQDAWEKRAALMMSPGAQEDIAAIQKLQAASKSAGRTFGNPGFNASTFALRKIEPYFTEEKNAARDSIDQAIMKAFQTKYNQIINEGKLEDAEKLFFHIDNYEFLANSKKDGITVENSHEISKDDSYKPVYNPNSADDTNGHVSAFYTNTVTDYDTLIEFLAPLFGTPGAVAQILMKLYKSLDPGEYYRNNPYEILKPGDVSIYFEPENSGKYIKSASRNYYRDGEWLYTQNPSGSDKEYGANFNEYAKDLHKGFDISSIEDILDLALDLTIENLIKL